MNKVSQYIYICTDSVYQATNFEGIKYLNGVEEIQTDRQPRLRELPQEVQNKLKDKDSYGYRKLEIEQFLSDVNGLKLLSLRLADVIGPYDDSCRFWKYLLWQRVVEEHKLELNKSDHLDLRMSFTFSEDVARFICHQIS
jgi:nucleoside-diphosphate-sugar epimerase